MSPWCSAFLNSMFFMIAGAVIVYIGMSMMFPRRRPVGVFVAYMAIKGLLWSLYDASYVLGTMGTLEHTFQVVGTPLLGALSYVVLYYTWKGEFYKIGLGGFLLDIITSVSMIPVFVLANGLFASLGPLDYRGYLGVATLFRCGGMVALNLLFLFAARPLFRWFGSYEFVHKNIWQAVVIASIVMATLPRMASSLQVARPIYVALALAVFLLIPFCGYMVSRARIERKRRALLENEIELVEGYGRSIKEQLPRLEECATQLDEIAKRIANVQDDAEETELKEQVTRLKDECDRMKHGLYSDSPALDVVLSTSKEAFVDGGLTVAYCVSSLGDAAVRAALVSQVMLPWAYDSCKSTMRQMARRSKTASIQGACANDGPDVEYRVVREGDQLAFMMGLPSNRWHRFPRSLIKDRVPDFDGVLIQEDDGQRKTVRVLVPAG